MVRVICLDYHPSNIFASACTAGHLTEQSKSPFSGPEIGQIYTDVRQHHSHESHVGNIEAFGHHLGAHQHLSVATGQAGHSVFGVLARTGGVGVQPVNGDSGQQLLDLFHHPLGAGSQLPDMGATAGRAGVRHPGAAVATVAEQPLLIGVVSERDGTAPAGDHVAAVPALNDGRSAPSIEEEDGLMSVGDTLLQSLGQCPAKDTAITIPQFPPHVADLDLGQA